MSKVIYDPTSEEAKALLDKLVEGSDCYNFSSKWTRKLVGLNFSNDKPFQLGGLCFTFIRTLPEKTYAERQAEWVESNNAKKGTKVKIFRHFKDSEEGCDCIMSNLDNKRHIVGQIGKICDISDVYVMVQMNDNYCWSCPFTALEIVKPTYRPYTDEEMKGIHTETVIDNNGFPMTVTGIKRLNGETIVLLGGFEYLTAQSLLDSGYTIDGHKCGVLV